MQDDPRSTKKKFYGDHHHELMDALALIETTLSVVGDGSVWRVGRYQQQHGITPGSADEAVALAAWTYFLDHGWANFRTQYYNPMTAFTREDHVPDPLPSGPPSGITWSQLYCFIQDKFLLTCIGTLGENVPDPFDPPNVHRWYIVEAPAHSEGQVLDIAEALEELKRQLARIKLWKYHGGKK